MLTCAEGAFDRRFELKDATLRGIPLVPIGVTSIIAGRCPGMALRGCKERGQHRVPVRLGRRDDQQNPASRCANNNVENREQ